MTATDRDLTDLGLAAPISIEELRELRRIRREQVRDEDQVQREPALPTQRSIAMEQVRRELGWGPSRSAELARECPECMARPTHWCRRGGRVIPGRICEARTRSD